MIKKVKKGFTLIELVVVIAVIAILSAVSVVAYVGITNSAKKSTAKSNADQIVNVLRAGALANADGYKEQTPPSEGKNYTVSLDGRQLKITKATGDEREDLAILNDMIVELGEKGIAADAFRADPSDATISQIGVLVQGSESVYEYASF